MTGLSVVIPVYNGASTIDKLLRELELLDIEGGCEVILVNDGSQDNSWDVISDIRTKSKLHVIAVNLSKNFGEHNAVMAGLSYARGEFVINIDDDFQNPPSEVKRLYDYARAHSEFDVVYTYYVKKKHALWRNLGSWITNAMANFMLDKPKELYLSSFRCMNRFLIQQIVKYEGPYPYIDGLIMQSTRRIGKLCVEHRERASGESSYTLRKLIRLWMNMFLNFSVMPLRISTLLGFCAFGSGLVLAFMIVIESIYTSTPPGWGSIIVSVLIFSGVQLLIIGIIGEYVGRLFITTNKKPQYVVRMANIERMGESNSELDSSR